MRGWGVGGAWGGVVASGEKRTLGRSHDSRGSPPGQGDVCRGWGGREGLAGYCQEWRATSPGTWGHLCLPGDSRGRSPRALGRQSHCVLSSQKGCRAHPGNPGCPPRRSLVISANVTSKVTPLGEHNCGVGASFLPLQGQKRIAKPSHVCRMRLFVRHEPVCR